MDSPATSTTSSPAATARRRSGRVPKQRDFLVKEAGVPAKRKRGEGDEEGEDVDEDDTEDDDEEDDSEDTAEDGMDEEEAKTRRKRARKSAATAKTKRAAKKPKQNGDSVGLAIRTSKPKAARPRTKRAVRFSAIESGSGLYGALFTRNSR
jgi:cohesin complex subunit SA-1/2